MKTTFTAMLLITLWLLSGLSIAQTEIYKSVDEQGNTVFSDNKQEDSETITVEDINTVPGVEGYTHVSKEPKSTPKNFYNQLIITSPKDQTIIPNGPGNFEVTVTTEPALDSRHQIQLLLNGAVYATGNQSHFQLKNVRRGESIIQANIVDTKSTVLQQSSTVKVFVFRPSVK